MGTPASGGQRRHAVRMPAGPRRRIGSPLAASAARAGYLPARADAAAWHGGRILRAGPPTFLIVPLGFWIARLYVAMR